MKILLSLLVFVACNGKAPLPTEPAAKTSDCSHITDLFERFACEGAQEETEDTEESPSSDSSESIADTTVLITKLSFRASELDFGQTEDVLKWGVKNLSTLDTIRFSISSSASWLTTNPSVGILPPGQFKDIYVSVDRTQDQVGNQEGTLTVQVEKRIKNIKVFVQFPNPEPVFFAYGAFPVVAPDGRVLYVRMEDRGDLNIRIVHADRTGWDRLTAETTHEFGPVISPDGEYVAYESTNRNRSTRTVHVMDMDGFEIFPPIKNAISPVWYKDYSQRLRLAFISITDNTIASVDSDGFDRQSILGASLDGLSKLAVSSNFRRIAYMRDSADNTQDGIGLISLGIGQNAIAQLVRKRNSVVYFAWDPYNALRLFYAPNNTTIRYVDAPTGSGKVAGIRPPVNQPVNLAPPTTEFTSVVGGEFTSVVGGYLSWAPNGQQIAIASTNSTNPGIFIVPRTGGIPKKWVHRAVDPSPPAWSIDGQYLYFSRNENVYRIRTR